MRITQMLVSNLKSYDCDRKVEWQAYHYRDDCTFIVKLPKNKIKYRMATTFATALNFALA